jgi:hypothetical protein
MTSIGDDDKTLEIMCQKVSLAVKDGSPLSELKDILMVYEGEDWNDHCSFCTQSYKRNHVFGDEYIDVYMICWNDKQESGVHDHPENGCLLRIMKGELREDVYINEQNVIKRTKTNYLYKNDISYKIGKGGLHNVINEGGKAISLHIYSPPNHKLKFYPMESCV